MYCASRPCAIYTTAACEDIPEIPVRKRVLSRNSSRKLSHESARMSRQSHPERHQFHSRRTGACGPLCQRVPDRFEGDFFVREPGEDQAETRFMPSSA